MATDEELLADFARGDETAIAELLSRYEQELFAFLQRFVNNAVVAEDLFQETFIQVYRNVSSFDSTRRFRPWLFTIAANKARDYLRLNVRHTVQSLDSLTGTEAGNDRSSYVELMEADVSSAPERLMQDEDKQAVRQALAKLPDRYREVLLLSYFHGFAYKQIAQILDIPLGTVKSRLHAGLAQFARLWNGRINKQ